jgi:hypothetical protein
MEDWIYLKKHEIHSCLICGEELVYTGDRALETLNEHAGDPNGEIVPKFLFQCENKYCLANILNFGWNSSGDFYTPGRYVPTDHIKFIKDITSSLGSYQRGHDEKKAWEKSRTFRIPIGPHFGVFSHNLLILDFHLHPRNPIHWNIGIWWKGCWVMNIPGTIIWKIRRRSNRKER